MKVLLAIDGSEFGKNAAKKCSDLLNLNEGSELLVVSVAENQFPIGIDHFGVSSEMYAPLRDQMVEVAKTSVAEALEVFEATDSNRATIDSEVLVGSPKVQIVERAKEWGADLIVLGSHGYGLIERVLLGSVSQTVLHNATCSVLIVKNDPAEAE